MAMHKAIPPMHDTFAARERRLKAERDAQKHPRLQALDLGLPQQARTRRHVARRLGVNRDTVGRWWAASEAGGLSQLLTIAKAPGTVPLVSPAIRQALRGRLAQPDGFASYKAIWQWLHQEHGLALAY
jgi:hypothetical protein